MPGPLKRGPASFCGEGLRECLVSTYSEGIPSTIGQLSPPPYGEGLGVVFCVTYAERFLSHVDKLLRRVDKALTCDRDSLSAVESASTYVDKVSSCVDQASRCVDLSSRYVDKVSTYDRDSLSAVEPASTYVDKVSSYVDRGSRCVDRSSRYADKLSTYVDWSSRYVDKASTRDNNSLSSAGRYSLHDRFSLSTFDRESTLLRGEGLMEVIFSTHVGGSHYRLNRHRSMNGFIYQLSREQQHLSIEIKWLSNFRPGSQGIIPLFSEKYYHCLLKPGHYQLLYRQG